jgi:hypothetical protein
LRNTIVGRFSLSRTPLSGRLRFGRYIDATYIYIVSLSRFTANEIPNGIANKDRPDRICIGMGN